MSNHVAYDREIHGTAGSLLACIVSHLARGWELAQIHGAPPGPYLALFRKEDGDDVPHPAC